MSYEVMVKRCVLVLRTFSSVGVDRAKERRSIGQGRPLNDESTSGRATCDTPIRGHGNVQTLLP
jgi:hypothetical protein